MSDFNFTALASECRHKLKDDGFDVLHVEDLSTIRELVEVLGKPYLTPRLSPFLNDFTPNNCFWLLLTRGDETVAAGGCRFDDLGDMKLSQFWRNCVARHYARTGGAVVDVAPPVDAYLSGRLA